MGRPGSSWAPACRDPLSCLVLSACLAGAGSHQVDRRRRVGLPLCQTPATGAELPCKYPRFTRFMTSLAVKFATSSTEHTGRGTDRNRERQVSKQRRGGGRTAGRGAGGGCKAGGPSVPEQKSAPHLPGSGGGAGGEEAQGSAECPPRGARSGAQPGWSPCQCATRGREHGTPRSEPRQSVCHPEGG